MSPVAFLYEIRMDRSPGDCWTITDKPLTVGRGEFADAVVDDDSLSRSHFLVLREAGEYFVIDLDSQNGTWLGKEKVNGQRLRSGQMIRAGRSLFYFSTEKLVTAPSLAAMAAAPANVPDQVGLPAQ